jgi:predicted RNase H-like nuclease (RuvC/YqgF family)
MEALDQLSRKLDALLKKYSALEAENKRLQAAIGKQDKTMEALSKKLSSLENGMVSVHLGKTVTDDSEKENMRKQLDQVITEIDKILHTLND